MKPRALFVTCVVFVAACSPSTPETPSDAANTEGALQGVDIGADIREVMAREQDHIIHQMPAEITTRILNDQDSNYHEITYFAEGDTVYAVEMVVRPPSPVRGLQLHQQFVDYYSVQYGTADTVERALQWTAQTDLQPLLEIALHNRLTSSHPNLMLTFHQVAP